MQNTQRSKRKEKHSKEQVSRSSNSLKNTCSECPSANGNRRIKWHIADAEIPAAVVRIVVLAALVGVAALATGCLALPDQVKSDIVSNLGNHVHEKSQTKSESLPTTDLQHGGMCSDLLRSHLARRYCATCHVSDDATVTAQHTRYASYFLQGSSLLCP